MTPHVVVFGELSPRARVQYTRFLLDNRVPFCRRESDGRYVANIRLTLPGSSDTIASAGTMASPSVVEADEASEDTSDGASAAPAVPSRFQRLANLIVLIGERQAKTVGGTTGPYVKETRLVRLINEIYDARYEESAFPAPGSSNESPSDSFARFVRHYLTNRFGLRKIVDQQCWELVEGLTSLQHRLDVELFISFIEGKYADWALAFFFSARSYVQRLLSAPAYRPTLHKSTRSAANKRRPIASLLSSAAPLWLSKFQLEALGPLVFNAKTDDLHIEFTRAVRAFISSDPDASASRSVAKALTVSEFLLLAVETYHKSGGNRDVQTQRSPLEHRRIPSRDDPQAAGGSMTPKSVDTPVSSTGAITFAFAEERPAARTQEDGDRADDVQARLGSLLERAKLRQQQRQGASFGL